MRGDVVPKLVDFGLSKAISSDDPSSSLTATELVSGRLITWYGPSLVEAAGMTSG